MARPPSPLGHAQLQQAAPGTRYFIGGLEAELQVWWTYGLDKRTITLYSSLTHIILNHVLLTFHYLKLSLSK